jgi:hypothetical protein
MSLTFPLNIPHNVTTCGHIATALYISAFDVVQTLLYPLFYALIILFSSTNHFTSELSHTVPLINFIIIMSTDPFHPSPHNPRVLISPSTFVLDEEEKQRRVHFTDGHNSSPTQLARCCFPTPILLDTDDFSNDMPTTLQYSLLIKKLQAILQTLYFVRTNHSSPTKLPHLDPRLQGTYIPRLVPKNRRQLILWCATC